MREASRALMHAGSFGLAHLAESGSPECECHAPPHASASAPRVLVSAFDAVCKHVQVVGRAEDVTCSGVDCGGITRPTATSTSLPHSAPVAAICALLCAAALCALLDMVVPPPAAHGEPPCVLSRTSLSETAAAAPAPRVLLPCMPLPEC